MGLFAGVLAVVVVLLGLLAFAPSLRVFDAKQARGLFLGALALVAVTGGATVRWWARREATQRERAASLELLAALEARTPAALRADVVDPTGPPGLPGVTRAEVAADGTLRVFRPVGYGWVQRCVLGEVTPDGRPSVRRVHASCP